MYIHRRPHFEISENTLCVNWYHENTCYTKENIILWGLAKQILHWYDYEHERMAHIPYEVYYIMAFVDKQK